MLLKNNKKDFKQVDSIKSQLHQRGLEHQEQHNFMQIYKN